MEICNCLVISCQDIVDNHDKFFCRFHRDVWNGYCEDHKITSFTRQPLVQQQLKVFMGRS